MAIRKDTRCVALTQKERAILREIQADGGYPKGSALRRGVSKVSKAEAQLIEKGFIYKVGRIGGGFALYPERRAARYFGKGR